MKIFSASQIKDWDAATIKEQGLLSTDLMERAANACFQWLVQNNLTTYTIIIFCGKGNNGGDGLALARIMLANNIPVSVYILENGKKGSDDFEINLQRLRRITTNIHFILSESQYPGINKNTLIIDALFGTGLNAALSGMAESLVQYINKQECIIVSIDVPSGLFIDQSSMHVCKISATHTLSFQQMKIAFLFPENGTAVGNLHLLDIGLSKKYENEQPSPFEVPCKDLIRSIIKPRNKFSHKGNYGHALIIAGSYGMMGACVLAARACLAAGTGKLTCLTISSGFDIIQSTVPEAMCKDAGDRHISMVEDMTPYDAIGIGPGIGTTAATFDAVKKVLAESNKKLVIDADALNCIGLGRDLISLIPPGSLLTPHPKEFERMFGPSSTDFDRLELAIKHAAILKSCIVLKGHYTAVVTPYGKVYFNNTGNAGMAKGGMGDVLTGIVTGLMAQGYALPEAALLGVYLHGLAGDIASERYSQPAMQAGDLINCIPDAWKIILN